MNITREIPPTAGFALGASDILSGVRRGKMLEDNFKDYLGLPYARVSCSGTAAFYLILETIKGLNKKRKVVIPSFVCPLLPLAIARAGLETLVCDIENDSFNFDPGQLEEICRGNQDILAITAIHLAGIPQDLSLILALGEKYNIFVIEDCAQSLGASAGNLPCGALGDFSFFSLCRGKGLTIYEGGLIVSKNNKYARELDNNISLLVKNAPFLEALRITELTGYALMYRPALAWFIFGMPRSYWNWRNKPIRAAAEYFDMDFPVHRVSLFRQRIGSHLFSRLEREIAAQREKAAYYIEKLRGIEGLKLITEPDRAKAAYPYLTLVFDDPRKKISAQRLLRLRGLGPGLAYAASVTEYDYLQKIVGNKIYPNGLSLAEKHLTLSTNSFLRSVDLETIVRLVKNL